MSKLLPYAKALVGGGIAFAGAMAVGYADDVLTQGELWFSIGTGLGGLAGVFAVPNKDPEAEHQDESVQPPN